MAAPTISIVVPFYNEEGFIAENLERILAQSVPPEEVILVDNNSKDCTRRIAEELAPRFLHRKIRFQIIEVHEQGQVAARIAGFDRASCELMGMIDTDTLLSKNWVKNAKRLFTTSSVVALCGPVYYSNIGLKRRITLFLEFVFCSLFQRYSMLWGCNAVVSKEAFEAVNGLNDYDDFHNRLGLEYIYDDNFLSWKLGTVGKVRFFWRLWVRATDRCDSKRLMDRKRNYHRIREHLTK